MPSSSPLLPLHLFSLEGHQYLGTEEKPGEDADRIESLHDVGNRPDAIAFSAPQPCTDAKGSQVDQQFLYELISVIILPYYK